MAEKSLWLHPEGKEIFSSLLLSLILPLIFRKFPIDFLRLPTRGTECPGFCPVPKNFPKRARFVDTSIHWGLLVSVNHLWGGI